MMDKHFFVRFVQKCVNEKEKFKKNSIKRSSEFVKNI